MVSRKKPRISNKKSDSFEILPDDLLISILAKLSSSSSCPSDFFNALLVCKRFSGLGMNKVVLSKASSGVFAIKAKNWCESAHRFLKLGVCAGSVEAFYFLGMIRFYCLDNKGIGRSLMAKAAIKSHAPALYSLAVIQFNGSGGTKNDKDLRAGVALCARAAFLGHVDAHRELGHCIQDGYGINQNVPEGRKLLVQANARELASVLPHLCCNKFKIGTGRFGSGYRSQILSDYGCNVPAPEPHPANKFLVDWFETRELGPELRLCSYAGCGRPETRPHEFRRCSVCGTVNYCSRGCQAIDWKLRHKWVCSPMGQDLGAVGGAPVNEIDQVAN